MKNLIYGMLILLLSLVAACKEKSEEPQASRSEASETPSQQTEPTVKISPEKKNVSKAAPAKPSKKEKILFELNPEIYEAGYPLFEYSKLGIIMQDAKVDNIIGTTFEGDDKLVFDISGEPQNYQLSVAVFTKKLYKDAVTGSFVVTPLIELVDTSGVPHKFSIDTRKNAFLPNGLNAKIGLDLETWHTLVINVKQGIVSFHLVNSGDEPIIIGSYKTEDMQPLKQVKLALNKLINYKMIKLIEQ